MTLTKFDFLCKAAESYIGQTELDLDIQFDLIAIDLYENGTYALRYLPNVMSPRW